MISYCPLEEDFLPPPPQQIRKRLVQQKKEEQGILEGENTECNYLVLFFILGVLILAASDSLRK